MEQFGPEQIGKMLIIFGVVIVTVGIIIILLGHIGLCKLPGDMEFSGKNWKVYIPIASCIVISIVLTLILWLINYFKR